MPIRDRAKPTATAKKNAGAPAKKQPRVRKLVFDKAQFATEEAVRKYLEENNWSGSVVKADGNTFTASGDGVEDDHFENVKSVPMEQGVIGYVGTLTEEGVKKFNVDEGDAAEEGDDEQETVLKFDWYDMHCSDGDSLKEVLEDGMDRDGCPPGVMEIVQASAYAIGNVLKGDKSERTAKLGSIGKELAAYVSKVAEVYDSIGSAKKTENVKKFEDGFKSFIDQVVAKKLIWPTGLASQNTGTASVDGAPSAAAQSVQAPAPAPQQPPHNASAVPVAPKTTGSPVTARPSNPTEYPRPGEAAPSKGDSEAVPAEWTFDALKEFLGSTVAKAMEPVGALSTQVAALARKVDEVAQTASGAAEQVTKIAERAPVKKGATDPAEPGDANKDANGAHPAQKRDGLRNFSAAIGMMTRG